MRLGDYELLEEIGRGGAGVVYRARSLDGRVVAIKRLQRPEPQALERFRRERRLLAKLGEEKGFVPLLADGESMGGSGWYVMPLLEGGTLRDRLKKGRLPDEETRALARSLARALAAAHELGIVHRDLKPENVIFDRPGGRPLVADLGLAKHFASSESLSLSGSLTGVLRGTAGYMSPEQMRDAKMAGPQADVFSLGAILYECLTGTPAFHGASILELISKVEAGSFVPLRTARRDAPADLAAVVERALASDPASRFADGASVLRALERGVPGRSRTPVVAVVALALVAAAGAGAWWWRPARRVRALLDQVAITKDAERKVELCTRALEIDPASAEALGTRAAFYAARGFMGRAFHDADAALALDPGQAQALSVSACRHVYNLEHETALAEFERAIASLPGNGDLLVSYSTALDAAGKLPESRRAAERGLALLRSTNLASPALGIAFAKGLDSDDALRSLEDAAKKGPPESAVYCALGVVHRERRELQAAVAAFTRAIELDPRFLTPRHGRASVLIRAGRPRDAIADASFAIELDPDGPTGWSNRAAARADLSDYPGAIADANRALAIIPRYADAYVTRGIAHTERDERDLARQDFEHALALAPRSALAWGELARLHLRSGDLEAAIEASKKSIAIEPQVASLQNLAMAYGRRGDHAEAIEAANRVLALDDTSATAYAVRGMAHYRLHELAPAREDDERALALKPGDRVMTKNLVVVLEELGERARAADALERYLALDPDDPEADQMRALIVQLRAPQ